MVDQFFKSDAHGNYSRYQFPEVVLEAGANGTTTKIGNVPAGIEIHQAYLKFGANLTSPGTTTYDLGLRQVTLPGEEEGVFEDSLDEFFDDTGRAVANNLRTSVVKIPPVNVSENGVEMVITRRTAALAAGAKIPVRVAVDYTPVGSL